MISIYVLGIILTLIMCQDNQLAADTFFSIGPMLYNLDDIVKNCLKSQKMWFFKKISLFRK